MEEGWSHILLLLLGGGTLLYWTTSILWMSFQLARCYIWARLVKGEPWTKRFGQWAVVTGASDGIGKAYVHKLAERGMDVVLIARNKDKLDTVAQTVRSAYGIETSLIVADFSKGQPIYEQIAKGLEDKDIGALVNNVGVFGMDATVFSDWEVKPIWDIVNINVAAIPSVTKIVLPGMLKRKRGVIINIGSILSVMPTPGNIVYSASKAFIDFFTQALAVECEETGVLVQGVHAGLVHTNITKLLAQHRDMGKIPKIFFPTADVFVESALSTVGYAEYTHGYWGHSLYRAMIDILKALPFKIGPRIMMKEAIKTRKQFDKAL